jgi:hypothetical protein
MNRRGGSQIAHMSKRSAIIAGLLAVAAGGAAVGITLASRGGTPTEQEAATSVAGSPTPPPAARGKGSPPPEAMTFGWRTDFDTHSVPFDEIQSGGPPKDGIPAIDAPRFVSVGSASFLRDREPVIALEVDGEVRAYPIQILMWHEIVNDEVGGTPVTVTFCPLCNTAIVFDRRVGGRLLDFGTTGNLRNSDLVMYDRQTESWWQQFSGEAIVGELTGTRLRQLAARIVAWRDFRSDHPGGQVLSRRTGFDRAYGRNPYEGYDDASTPPFFDVANGDDDRLLPKERVVYLEAGDETAAVPYTTLRKRREVTVELGGRTLVVRWAPGVASALGAGSIADGNDIGSAQVLENGRAVPFHEPFWFAVAAFRPDTRIIR